jgi:cytochrome b involved in lipid metabolism/ferredoxin-NADP reductase
MSFNRRNLLLFRNESTEELACEKVLFAPQDFSIHEGQVSLTHGFLPYAPLMEQLPSAYHHWDNIAALISEHMTNGSERDEINKLPLLAADDASQLPDEYLARAAAILGNLAHAYYFNQREGQEQHEDPLPANLRTPWEQVIKRINRKLPDYAEGKLKAARTHYDTFLCNWKLTNENVIMDGINNVDIELNDLDLLVPAFSNNEEHVFNLTITLMEIRFAPALKELIHAIQAVADNNDGQLIGALQNLTFILERVTAALDYLTPNEYSEHYVDPTVWTKTVAKFDGTIPGGLPGLSASLLPLFHTLDCFIERHDYESELGKAIVEKYAVQPQRIFDFIHAMRQDLSLHSLKRYVQQSKNPVLKAHYQNFVDAYLGEYGLTAVHAVKAYGYMKINFRAGRLETNGGNIGSATVDAEPQRKIYQDFKKADKERLQLRSYNPYPLVATKIKVQQYGNHASEIILDVSATGMVFLPGDRCAILPENSDKTIASIASQYHFQLTDEIVLNDVWKQFFQRRWRKQVDKISLQELLPHADLKIIETNNHEQEFTIDALKPLTPRMYSVSPLTLFKNSGKIRLTVGRHFYLKNGLQHEGLSSGYLTHGKPTIHIAKAPARLFRLPQDPSAPVIMFAAGTGISPFLSFIDVCRQMKSTARLLWSTPTRETFYYRDELATAVSENVLELDVIFSRETPNSVVFDQTTNQFRDVNKYDGKHIDAIIKENAQALHDLIIGQNAYIYVCGSSGFATLVRTAIQQALATIDENIDSDLLIKQLVASHRYNSDVFTPTSMALQQAAAQPIYRSDIAYHNTKNDCWIIINNRVYDLSKFINFHPGGKKIILVNAGKDGSADYNDIGHQENSQIEALLLNEQIGVLAKTDFSDPQMRNLYAKLIGFLDALVEMDNTLTNNTTFPTNDPAPYLWREVYSVFVDGRIASYNIAGTIGSFKFVFGPLLNNLFDLVNHPKKDWGNLHSKASECGNYIRNTSIGNLKLDELKKIENIYLILLAKTFEFIRSMRNTVCIIAKSMETYNGDINKIYSSIALMEKDVTDYALTISHIHRGLDLANVAHSNNIVIPAAPCAFAQMSHSASTRFFTHPKIVTTHSTAALSTDVEMSDQLASPTASPTSPNSRMSYSMSHKRRRYDSSISQLSLIRSSSSGSSNSTSDVIEDNSLSIASKTLTRS